MKLPALLFSLPAVQGWDTRLQGVFLAPPDPAPSGLPVDVEEVPPFRLRIIVNRWEAAGTDATAQYVDVRTTLLRNQRGVEELVEPKPLRFGDGVVGVVATIGLGTSQQMRLVELHAFRTDGGVVTQLVATAAEDEVRRRQDELVRLFQEFVPASVD